TVRLVCAGNTGGLFTSVTTTVKLLVALSGGAPLSVTLMVIGFVLGPCASVGVQVKIPLVGLTVAPAGAPGSRLNVSVSPFGSVALLVNVSVDSSLIVLLDTEARTGGLLVAPLVIVNIPVALVE